MLQQMHDARSRPRNLSFFAEIDFWIFACCWFFVSLTFPYLQVPILGWFFKESHQQISINITKMSLCSRSHFESLEFLSSRQIDNSNFWRIQSRKYRCHPKHWVNCRNNSYLLSLQTSLLKALWITFWLKKKLTNFLFLELWVWSRVLPDAKSAYYQQIRCWL